MLVIKNAAGLLRCHPGTNRPYMFNTMAGARKAIAEQGLVGAIICEAKDLRGTADDAQKLNGNGGSMNIASYFN